MKWWKEWILGISSVLILIFVAIGIDKLSGPWGVLVICMAMLILGFFMGYDTGKNR